MNLLINLLIDFFHKLFRLHKSISAGEVLRFDSAHEIVYYSAWGRGKISVGNDPVIA